MGSSILRRVIWNIVPAAMLAVMLWVALVGENGMLRRHGLKQDLRAIRADIAQVEDENDALRRQIDALRTDPVVLQRETAAELLRSSEGSTIYRFDSWR